jgi:protein TonB
MFEDSVLDNGGYGRSQWPWMGLVAQAGIVSGMFLVPLLSPQILSVMLPKALLYIPLKPVTPVEVAVQPSRPATAATAHALVAARPAARVFRAPATIQPVANLIDPAGYEPPVFSSVRTDGDNAIRTGDGGPGITGIGGVPTAPPPRPGETAKTEPPRRIRVGGEVLGAKILSRVNPVYPPLAKQARIQGLVKLEGVIAKDGTIEQLRLLSGHPLLAPAALAAVRQWRYRPTHLNGEPVEVVAPIEVHFILSH